MENLTKLQALCPDLLALGASLLLALLYHFFINRKRNICPMHTLQGIARLARREWVDSVIEGHNGMLGVQTLRNSTMVSSFMASTSSLLALGVLSLAASSESDSGAWRILHLIGSPFPEMLAVKVLALLLVLFFAFYCFAASIRLYGHVSFIISTCAGVQEEERRKRVSRICLEQAARQFHMGMRAFYFLVPLVLWLFGPIFLVLGMLGILITLYRIDYVPAASDMTQVPCNQDVECPEK